MSNYAACIVSQQALSLGCQIKALRDHIIAPTSAFSAEDLGYLLSLLKSSEMAVGVAFSEALAGRAA